MKYLTISVLMLNSLLTFSQEPQYYRAKKKNKLIVLTPHDNGNIVMYQITGLFESAKKVVYIDSANTFQVVVPDWLKLKETNSLSFFGGTLPPINQVENAIAINSVKKDSYPSFSEFKKFIIEDSAYLPGTSPKWTNDRTFIRIEKDSVFNDRVSYKVSVNKKGKIFVSNYILIETKTAFLWIQFTATEETYSINIIKFEEFIKGLKLEI